jgi:hypothetical protein
MRYFGLLIMCTNLGVGIGAIVAGSGLMALLGLAGLLFGGYVMSWTVNDIGMERIVIDPSPVLGFNAYFEQRGMTGWHRDTCITGWGETQSEAEEDCRARVDEWKAVRKRYEETPTRIVNL